MFVSSIPPLLTLKVFLSWVHRLPDGCNAQIAKEERIQYPSSLLADWCAVKWRRNTHWSGHSEKGNDKSESSAPDADVGSTLDDISSGRWKLSARCGRSRLYIDDLTPSPKGESWGRLKADTSKPWNKLLFYIIEVEEFGSWREWW